MNYLVMDVGGSAIKYALMNDSLEMIEKSSVKTPMDSLDSFKNVVKDIYEKYKDEVDSYIDLDKEMFGYVAYNKDEAVNELVKLIECEFKVKQNQEDARNKFFRYNDNNNCERIYNTILEKLNNI